MNRLAPLVVGVSLLLLMSGIELVPVPIYMEQHWGGMFIAMLVNDNITSDYEFDGWRIEVLSDMKLMEILCNAAVIEQPRVDPYRFALNNVTYNGYLRAGDTLSLTITGYVSGLPAIAPILTADMVNVGDNLIDPGQANTGEVDSHLVG